METLLLWMWTEHRTDGGVAYTVERASTYMGVNQSNNRAGAIFKNTPAESHFTGYVAAVRVPLPVVNRRCNIMTNKLIVVTII